MLTNEYKVYVQECIKLARSLCVKSQQIIEGINNYLQTIGIDVRDIDESKWKYYVNLRGEYWFSSILGPEYSSNTFADDEIMYYTPLETDIVESLTVDKLHNLDGSRADTLIELRKFGSYYQSIRDKYPQQEELLRRIIDPITVPINDLLEMEDGTILYYDNKLIFENEKSLMTDLQIYIYNYVSRWGIVAFQNSDRLFAAAWNSIFYLAIVDSIISIRMSKIKTFEVHQFHLWNYLGGYYGLDKYRKYLTLDQALFLYKNIEYISNTPGTKDTLVFIYQNMIKENGMTLNVFDIRKDTSDFVNLKKPEIAINKYPVDASNILDYVDDITTVDDFMDRLANLTVFNSENIEQYKTDLLVQLSHNPDVTISTGIMECERSRNVLEGFISKESEKMDLLINLALSNKFPYTFNLDLKEDISKIISAKDAVYILLYCSLRMKEWNAIYTKEDPLHYNGVDVTISDVIPIIKLIDILRNDGMHADEYLPGNNEMKYSNISDTMDTDFYTDFNNMDDIEVLSDENNTVNSFNGLVDDIIINRLRIFISINNETNIYKRMELKRLIFGGWRDDSLLPNDPIVPAYFHITKEFNPADVNILNTNSWEEFFSLINFNLSELSYNELEKISIDILEHFIGIVKVNEGMISPYYEMMQILRSLTSYMVTIIPGKSSGNTKPIEWIENEFKLTNFTMNFTFAADCSNSEIIIHEFNNVSNASNIIYPQIYVS